MLQHFAIDVDLVIRALLSCLACSAHTMRIHTQKDAQNEGYRYGEEGDLKTFGHGAVLYSEIGLHISFELAAV